MPYHLCHFEVPHHVARVVLFGDAAIQPIAGPVVDVVTTAKIDLTRRHSRSTGWAGTTRTAWCENHDVVRAERLLPMGLAEGCVLTRDVQRDEPITLDDVEAPTGTLVHALRAEQDAMFAPAEEALR